MELKIGESYFYWGTSLPADDAIMTGIAAYKLKYDQLPKVVFCNPDVLPMIENPPVGVEVAANRNLNSHVYAFNLPNKGNNHA